LEIQKFQKVFAKGKAKTEVPGRFQLGDAGVQASNGIKERKSTT